MSQLQCPDLIPKLGLSWQCFKHVSSTVLPFFFRKQVQLDACMTEAHAKTCHGGLACKVEVVAVILVLALPETGAALYDKACNPILLYTTILHTVAGQAFFSLRIYACKAAAVKAEESS